MSGLIRKPSTFYVQSNTVPFDDLFLLSRGLFEKLDTKVERHGEDKVVIVFPYLKAIKKVSDAYCGMDVIVSRPHETLNLDELSKFEQLKRKYGIIQNPTTESVPDEPTKSKKQKRTRKPSDCE